MAIKKELPVEHMVFDLTHNAKEGAWFSVKVPDSKQALFSGPITKGMARQLRALAHAVSELEDAL